MFKMSNGPRPFLIVCLLAVAQFGGDAAVRRSLTSTGGASALNSPSAAADYLDGLFADQASARAKLTGNFVKKSNATVVYMCYDRSDIIQSSLTSLLLNEGLSDFDLFISQDGGTDVTVDDEGLQFINSMYIRHPTNLCTGLHHYFVKRFAFDIMGYEALIVIEEDVVIHPKAIQVLNNTLYLSVSDPEVGLASITDLDNSLLVDESRYNSAILRTDVQLGHLWAYAVHASRYNAVKQHLYDYYAIIKGHNYRVKDLPPLRDSITALHSSKGFPTGTPLSQDAFFVNSLTKEGFTRRFTTLVRLFEPMGWQGLHFKQDPNTFYGMYGKGMYEGSIDGEPFEVAKNATELANLEADCRERLDRIYTQYLGRTADQVSADTTVMRLLTGHLNAVELVKDVINSAEHRRRMKEFVTGRKQLMQR